MTVPNAGQRPGAVLIVGVTRSGTSYLYDLLNRHPGIRLAYESKVLTEGAHEYQKLAPQPTRNQFRRLLESLARLDEDERLNEWLSTALSEHEEALYEAHQEESSFARLIESVFQSGGPLEWWGNKMLRAEMVPSVTEIWPATRVIYLVRDPRDVFASQKRKFGSRRPAASAIYWSLHAKLGEESVAASGPDRQIILQYENLVFRPNEELERILQLLELDPGEAPTMLAATPVRTESVGQWRSQLDEREVEALETACFDPMKQYGYEASIATEGRELSTWKRGYETLLENAHQIPLNPAEWRRKRLLKRLWLAVRG